MRCRLLRVASLCKKFVVLLLCLWSNWHTTLLDTSLLTCQLTEVVDTCTAYNTILVNLDLVDVW